MIKICKAIISVEGTAYLAVHRDGQPDKLGRNIYEAVLSGKSITGAAAKHVIVAVVPRLLTQMNLGRMNYLVKKHKYNRDQIKNGYRRGDNLGAEDQFIISIKEYADRAEHQYDLREDGVYWRTLSGYWPGSGMTDKGFRKVGWVMLERLEREQSRSRPSHSLITVQPSLSPIGDKAVQSEMENGGDEM